MTMNLTIRNPGNNVEVKLEDEPVGVQCLKRIKEAEMIGKEAVVNGEIDKK